MFLQLNAKRKLVGNEWRFYVQPVAGVIADETSNALDSTPIDMQDVFSANKEWHTRGANNQSNVLPHYSLVQRDESAAFVLAVQERRLARGVPLPPQSRSPLQNLLVWRYCRASFNESSFLAAYVRARNTGEMAPLPSMAWLAKVLHGVSADYYDDNGNYKPEKAGFREQFKLAGVPCPFEHGESLLFALFGFILIYIRHIVYCWYNVAHTRNQADLGHSLPRGRGREALLPSVDIQSNTYSSRLIKWALGLR